MNQETFLSKDIGLCAAILSTGKVKFCGLSDDPITRKKLIHLAPKLIANDLYKKFLDGQLFTNARETREWVNRLKEVIFGGGPR